MSNRTLFTAISCLALLLFATQAWASGLCHFIVGREVSCTLDPDSGLCLGSALITIDGVEYTLEFERIDLGAPLSVAGDGTVKGVSSEDFRILENGVRFTTFGETTFTPTDDPAVHTFVERTELAAANRRYDSGVIVAAGEINLAEGTAAGSLVGKLCRSPLAP